MKIKRKFRSEWLATLMLVSEESVCTLPKSLLWLMLLAVVFRRQIFSDQHVDL